MRIKLKEIDRELRFIGIFMKILNNTFTPTRLRLFNWVTRKFHPKIKSKIANCEERKLIRSNGNSMRILIFNPKHPVKDVPGVLWIHGGGYAIGNANQGKTWAERFIETVDCVVISVEYTLSIQTPYPAALEDCYQALCWMKDHAQELGIRADQLFVGGDSAGGGLTAALSFYARDKQEVTIAYQMPLYPMIEDRMNTDSAIDNNAPIWNTKSSYNGWKLYLGDLFESNEVPYYAAPSRAEDYHNLPPTTTIVGDLEPFRDETINYVENLRKADIPVKFEIYPGCYHGFDAVNPRAKVTQQAIQFLMEAFQEATQKGN